MMIQRRLQRLGFHNVGIGIVIEGVDAARHTVLIDPLDELQTECFRLSIPEGDHLPELPGRVHMQQRERRLARREGLHRQMQHHRTVFADRIEHHGLLGFGGHFPYDMDAFGFEPLQMGQSCLCLQTTGAGVRHSCLPWIGAPQASALSMRAAKKRRPVGKVEI
jgi:hypothetical protein